MLYNYINKMMRQSEFKKKYDPDTGKFSRKHIYGEGIMDTVKSFLGKKPTKKKVTFAPPPKPTPASSNKKAGDKIVKMLSGEKPPSRKTNNRQMTQQEINNNVLRIMSGSGKKK